MASKRNTADVYRSPALDMATAKQLSKEGLLEALQSMSSQDLLDIAAANDILKERALTNKFALQSSKVESNEPKKELSPEQLDMLLTTLKNRFDSHLYRNKNITWEQVADRLASATPEKLWSLNEMERTGGEPDVVAQDPKTGKLRFEDRSPESPKGRRKCTYDKAAENEVKKDGWNPNGNAVDIAAAIGMEMLNKDEYAAAQKIDKLDRNSCSWLLTPIDKRKTNAAFFGGRLFYFAVIIDDNDPGIHNADCGVRGSLTI